MLNSKSVNPFNVWNLSFISENNYVFRNACSFYKPSQRRPGHMAGLAHSSHCFLCDSPRGFCPSHMSPGSCQSPWSQLHPLTSPKRDTSEYNRLGGQLPQVLPWTHSTALFWLADFSTLLLITRCLWHWACPSWTPQSVSLKKLCPEILHRLNEITNEKRPRTPEWPLQIRSDRAFQIGYSSTHRRFSSLW